MKKTRNMALLTLAVAALGLTSCKKDRTCTCTGTFTSVATTTNSSGTITDTESTPIAYTDVLKKTTKAAAHGNGDCMSRTETSTDSYSNGGTTTTTDYTSDITCTIK